MYKIYTDSKGYLNKTDFTGLVQALKFLVNTVQDIHNILNGIKKNNTIVITDKYGNDWRIDYVETL